MYCSHCLDIAIIKFPEGKELKCDQNLRGTSIFRLNFQRTNLELNGKIVTISGWGNTEINHCPTAYLKVTSNPIEQMDNGFYIWPNVLHMSQYGGRGSGHGDSGGISLLYK